MPYRVFSDSTGKEWQVWDIVPQLSERRESGEHERRVSIVPIEFADRRNPGSSRRMRNSRRAVLRGSYSQGWLCFDSDGEKRRLTPIPGDWTTCAPELLEAYLRNAERATGSYQAITDADPQLAEQG